MDINDISPQLEVAIEGSVLSVKFNRPDKMNSFTFEMYRSLTQILDHAEKSDDIRAIVFSGNGGNFSAGNDIKDFVTVLEQKGMGRHHDAPAFIDALREFSKPIIAAVDGFAVGIGATLLLYCDLVYVSKDAKFRTPFTHLGLCPEAAASYILPKMMGRARAAEWLLLGEIITAEQAQSDGVVTRITDNPLKLALEKAKILSTMSTTAIKATKQLMTFDDEVLRKTFDEEMLIFSKCLESKEACEAFKKFLEK